MYTSNIFKYCPKCGASVMKEKQCLNCKTDFANVDKWAAFYNDEYEYAIEMIQDNNAGGANKSGMAECIRTYTRKGWRLKQCFTNEVGKNAMAIMGAAINATTDQIVLLFERKVRNAGSDKYLFEVSQSENNTKSENKNIVEMVMEAIADNGGRIDIYTLGNKMGTEYSLQELSSILNELETQGLLLKIEGSYLMVQI